jgi:hypothetical protein
VPTVVVGVAAGKANVEVIEPVAGSTRSTTGRSASTTYAVVPSGESGAALSRRDVKAGMLSALMPLPFIAGDLQALSEAS